MNLHATYHPFTGITLGAVSTTCAEAQEWPVALRNGTSLVCRLVSVLAVCMVLAGPASAQPTVGVSDGVGFPNKPATVFAVNRGLTNVVALQFDVSYDRARLTSLTVPEGCDSQGNCVKSRVQSNGVHRVILYSLFQPLPAAGDRFFSRLVFLVSPNTRTDSREISLTSVQAAKSTGGIESIQNSDPGVIYIQPVYRAANGVVEFFLSSETNVNYAIEATTNFTQWVTITNVTGMGDWMDLIDRGATNIPWRFYRSREIP